MCEIVCPLFLVEIRKSTYNKQWCLHCHKAASCAKTKSASNMSIPEDDVKKLNVKNFKLNSADVKFNSLSFCKSLTLDARKELCAKMKAMYPDGVGVVLHLANEPLKELSKHLKKPDTPYIRVVVRSDVQMSELIMHARRMFSKDLPPVAGMFLYLCDGDVERIVSLQAPFREYMERAMKDDGLCHFVVTVEAVFGH